MCEKTEKKTKRVIPVLSYKEFLDQEINGKKFPGPYKIKAEDAEKALEYFKRR